MVLYAIVQARMFRGGLHNSDLPDYLSGLCWHKVTAGHGILWGFKASFVNAFELSGQQRRVDPDMGSELRIWLKYGK